MSENHQDTANHNSVTTETKLWLPPSYTNGKTPIAPAPPNPKKRGNNWGFADKSFWEWIILIGTILAAIGAIAIPFVVTILGLNFTQQQAQLSIAASERQHQTDLQIAQDQQREDVLVNYQKDISDLMLNYHLVSSKEFDVVRLVARAKTLTALRKLDPDRKRLLIQFLDEGNLINVDTKAEASSSLSLGSVINLYQADLSYINMQGIFMTTLNLSGADMYHANLYGAWIDCDFLEANGYVCSNLSYAILQSADLSYAYLPEDNLENANLSYANLNNINLEGANLNDANLEGANLKGADLSKANLQDAKISKQQLAQARILKGAIMPDGSVHP